jgi:hypothetical protein
MSGYFLGGKNFLYKIQVRHIPLAAEMMKRIPKISATQCPHAAKDDEIRIIPNNVRVNISSGGICPVFLNINFHVFKF